MQSVWLMTIAQHLRTRARAYVVLCLSLVMTMVAWHFSQLNYQLREQQRFEELSQNLVSEAQQRIDAYIGALHGLLGLFRASVSVERDEYSHYIDTTRLMERHPGLTGLAFARIIPASDLDAFFADLRRDTRYPISDTYSFAGQPEKNLDHHLITTFIEPQSVNHGLIGLDLLTDPSRRKAAYKARDTGDVIVSDAIDLSPLDDKGGLTGKLIMAPVYVNQRPTGTLGERRANFFGVVYARFSFGDFFPNLLTAPISTMLNLNVVDDEKRLLFSSDGSNPPDKPALHTQHTINVGDELWSLEIRALPTFMTNARPDPSNLIALAGLIISGLLFWLVNSLLLGAENRRIQDRRFAHQANHDSLTDLPNRNLVYAEITRILGSGDCAGKFLALLLLDLNAFKEINDTLGHHSGDRLLRLVGPRLQTRIKDQDMVARMGGDEFALLLCSASSRSQVMTQAQQILGALHEPFVIDGLTLRISASIGIALYPDHGNDVSTLMRCADIAMYQAKHDVHGISVYDPGLDEHNPRRLSRMTDLDTAIRTDGLSLHYQPVIRLSDHRVERVEALLRWPHPKQGNIPPMEFIPQAEHCELITPLTVWVLDNALAQRRIWRDMGLNMKVAVNISARNLQDANLPTQIRDLLLKHAVAADQLELEITESAIISDPERTIDTLKRIIRLGVAVAIDDFGTGYTSLGYLKTLSAGCLKIDRSFVSDIMHDDNDAVIVRSIIDLAHNLGMTVIAEGVETQEVMDILDILRCDYAQGYHIAKPMPADALLLWMKSGGIEKLAKRQLQHQQQSRQH